MIKSPSESVTKLAISVHDNNNNNCCTEIPIEIISEEEMALLEAALASARSLSCSAIPALRSSHFPTNVRSIKSVTVLSKRGVSGFTDCDIEDSGDFRSTQKKIRVSESFFQRFRKKKGLSVTDITSTEWCEKQMEFVLFGKRKINKAMKEGSARHTKLEEEVVKKVKIPVRSVEDRWALKLINFIIGINQLLFEGMTRELPLVSYVEGIWMVGVIDEIRMPLTEIDRNPLLVDTKTRVQNTVPAEPQRRNGRFQLMCYKHMWDNLVAEKFPAINFCEFFSLDPNHIFSEEIIEGLSESGFPAKSLVDVIDYYINTFSRLPSANDQLLLRYEFQKDNSLIAEDQFAYDSDWLKKQLKDSLEFWLGEREANFTPKEERWKCRFCQFASVCPANATSSSTSINSNDNNAS